MRYWQREEEAKGSDSRKAVFRILYILVLIWILGSVHWITDPDPSAFGRGAFKIPTKN
jgi:hypothetical protein